MIYLAQILALALPFAALERIPRLRLRPASFRRPWFGSDLTYLATGYATGASLGTAYIVAGSRWLEAVVGVPGILAADASGVTVVPAWASAVLALVCIDLGNYAAHWLLHRSAGLWEIHKIHHSSPTLDWLATFRSHLLEQALRRLLAPLLLIVLGVPVQSVAAAYGLFLAFAVWNHSNIKASSAWLLEPLFITPRLHRVHHVPATTGCNLGTVFSLWDRALGTLVVPQPTEASGFGVPGEVETYPQGWWRQLVEPPARVLGLRRSAPPESVSSAGLRA